MILIILLPINLISQSGGTQTYTLNECLSIALRNNLDIKLSEESIKAADADLLSAFGNYLPSISYSMGYNRILNPEGPGTVYFQGVPIEAPGANPNSYNMGLNANMTIFDGFSREANFDRSQKSREVTELNTQQSVELVKRQVHTNFIQVTQNAQIVKIRRENIEAAKAQLEQIRARYEAGAAPIATVYSQEAEIGNNEISLITAENDLNIAKATLLTLMGMEPNMDAEFLSSSIPTGVEEIDVTAFRQKIGTLGAGINSALTNRIDYQSQKVTVEAAKSSVKLSYASYYPQVSAFGGWRWNNSEFNEFSDKADAFVGLNLSVPIFTNFNNNLQVQNSKLQLNQRQLELQKMEQQIRREVQTSYLTLQSAEKQLEISEKTVKAAEQNYLSTKSRFEVGAANVTDLTVANSQYITSQINRVNAVYNYLLAQKEVEYALGILE